MNIISCKTHKPDLKSIKNHAKSSSALVLMLHDVINTIAISVRLNMNKPVDCSVEPEDEEPQLYISKICQHARVSKDLYKSSCSLPP